jgi:hypothetical protein
VLVDVLRVTGILLAAVVITRTGLDCCRQNLLLELYCFVGKFGPMVIGFFNESLDYSQAVVNISLIIFQVCSFNWLHYVVGQSTVWCSVGCVYEYVECMLAQV